MPNYFFPLPFHFHGTPRNPWIFALLLGVLSWKLDACKVEIFLLWYDSNITESHKTSSLLVSVACGWALSPEETFQQIGWARCCAVIPLSKVLKHSSILSDWTVPELHLGSEYQNRCFMWP